MTITRDDVERARHRIGARARRTPVVAGPGTAPVVLKLEHLQHTGSFKVRGAFNRQLAARESGELDARIGVVAASGGNAGLAHAFAARTHRWPATVFVPEGAPPVKVAKLRAYGAEVVLAGREYAEAQAAALAHAATTGATFCHAYDQPDVVAGAGTLALELLEDVEVDTVVVAVGGGGLLAGVAAAVEGRARVVGVEPSTVPTLHSALAAGGPVDVEVSGVAADSLGARRLGEIAHAVAERTAVTSVLVEDDDVVEARRWLWEDWRIVTEHGAATAWAALLSGAYRPADGERVAVVLCGANTDPTTL